MTVDCVVSCSGNPNLRTAPPHTHTHRNKGYSLLLDSHMYFMFFFRREGMIRQIMPAVDLSYKDGKHRNRGLTTVPRAYGWLEFSNSLDEWDKYEIVLEQRKISAAESSSSSPSVWTELLSAKAGSVSKAIEKAMICLAESPPKELGTGSHFIHVGLQSEGNDKNTDGNSSFDANEANLDAGACLLYTSPSPRD